MYQPVLPHTDPLPPNTSQYRPILTQYHHISMSLNVPRDSVPRNKFPRDNVPWNNVPQDNCSSLSCPSQQCPSRQLFLVTIIHPFLYKWSFAKRTVVQMTKIKGTEDHRLLQMIIRMIQPPPFLWKWSFAKRTILQITKIKGMEEHRLLQMTILMIWPPPCSSAPLQMVICKEDGPPDDQIFLINIDVEVRW